MVLQHYVETMSFGDSDLLGETSVYVRREGDHVGDAKEAGHKRDGSQSA